MGTVSPILTQFNGGELSPLLEGRTDIAKYQSGCRTLQNFLPRVQGPAERRGGTRYVNTVKLSSQRTWLIPFKFNTSTSYQLEFGNGYVRFYRNRGLLGTTAFIIDISAGGGGLVTIVTTSGPHNLTIGQKATISGVIGTPALNGAYVVLEYIGDPTKFIIGVPFIAGGLSNAKAVQQYEITSPYSAADLITSQGTIALDYEQIGDVMYIACSGRPPTKLVRYAETNWAFSTFDPSEGPFQDQNTDQTITMYASGDGDGGASITITASKPVFVNNMVGMLLRLDMEDRINLLWRPLVDSIAGAGGYLTYNTNTYYIISNPDGNNATGADPPTHTSGSVNDGGGGASGPNAYLRYEHSGYGVCRITGYTSSTVVTATVVKSGYLTGKLPKSVVGSTHTTFRWRLGAWGIGATYPSSVAAFRDRLWWGGGFNVWASQPGLYDDYDPDVFNETTPDSAITARLPGNQVDSIVWFLSSDGLLIGTTGAEFLLSEITQQTALGPGNVKIEVQSHWGSRDVHPIGIGNIGMFVDRYGKRLRDIKFDIRVNRYMSDDVSILAEHITAKQIVSMAYAQTPYLTMWFAMADGTLASFTYNQEQQVQAWALHPVGGNGVVECVSVIPSPDGTRDDVWMIVRRFINGLTERYVEVMEKSHEAGNNQASAFYVDSGITQVQFVAGNVVSGLGHLVGMTVAVFADGAPQANKVVQSNGTITIDVDARVMNVGLPYTSTLTTMRLEGGSREGTGQGKVGRLDTVVVRYYNTLGLKLGPDVHYLEAIDFSPVNQQMGLAPPIQSGDSPPMKIDDDYGTNRWITVVQDQPCPATVIALMPKFSVEEY